jgi:hypothetical protein
MATTYPVLSATNVRSFCAWTQGRSVYPGGNAAVNRRCPVWPDDARSNRDEADQQRVHGDPVPWLFERLSSRKSSRNEWRVGQNPGERGRAGLRCRQPTSAAGSAISRRRAASMARAMRPQISRILTRQLADVLPLGHPRGDRLRIPDRFDEGV